MWGELFSVMCAYSLFFSCLVWLGIYTVHWSSYLEFSFTIFINVVSFTLSSALSFRILQIAPVPYTLTVLSSTIPALSAIIQLVFSYHSVTIYFFVAIALLAAGCFLEARETPMSRDATPKRRAVILFCIISVVAVFATLFTLNSSTYHYSAKCWDVLGFTPIEKLKNSVAGMPKSAWQDESLQFSCSQRLPWFYWNGRNGMWRTGNFGDDINLEIAAMMLNIPISRVVSVDQKSVTTGPKLLAAGSVASFINTSDLVWGSGCHEKSLDKISWRTAKSAKIFSLRGPLLCDIFRNHDIANCGRSFGDPGLLGRILVLFSAFSFRLTLAPLLWPSIRRPYLPKNDLCFLPHYSDRSMTSSGYTVIPASLPAFEVHKPRLDLFHNSMHPFLTVRWRHALSPVPASSRVRYTGSSLPMPLESPWPGSTHPACPPQAKAISSTLTISPPRRASPRPSHRSKTPSRPSPRWPPLLLRSCSAD
jgi:hypothetical protein